LIRLTATELDIFRAVGTIGSHPQAPIDTAVPARGRWRNGRGRWARGRSATTGDWRRFGGWSGSPGREGQAFHAPSPETEGRNMPNGPSSGVKLLSNVRSRTRHGARLHQPMARSCRNRLGDKGSRPWPHAATVLLRSNLRVAQYLRPRKRPTDTADRRQNGDKTRQEQGMRPMWKKMRESPLSARGFRGDFEDARLEPPRSQPRSGLVATTCLQRGLGHDASL
jgi:hypothetical protein